MTGSIPILDLVNINAYIKFDDILSVCSKVIEQTQYSDINQRQEALTNLRKMTSDNPNLDLVNINAYTKFGKIRYFCCQDIERKQNYEQNSDINQGP